MTDEEKKERKREYMRKYYQKNRESACEYARAQYHKNAEKKREYAREYRRKNSEKLREYNRNYRRIGYIAKPKPVVKREPMDDETAKKFLIVHQSNMSWTDIIKKTGRTYEELKPMYDEYFENIPKDPLYHEKLHEYYENNKDKFRDARNRYKEKLKKLEMERLN